MLPGARFLLPFPVWSAVLSAAIPASRRRHFPVSFALFLLLGFHVGVWAVQLGSLAASLRLDPGELGLALSGAAAGGIVTLFLGGRIADHFGRRTVLLIGFGVSGLSFAGLAAAQNFLAVVLAVVAYGLSISFVDLGANAVGADFESAHEIEAMTGLQAGFSLGAVVGALSSALLLAVGVDYRLVYVGLAVVFLAWALSATRVALPARSDPDSNALVTSRSSGHVWRDPGVVFAALVALVTFFGDGALEGFLAVFLREALDSGVLLSGIGIASFHVASFLGRTIASRILLHFPVRSVITASGVLAAVGIAVAVLAPAAWISIAGMLLVGFAISPVIPSALSLAGRAAPGRSGQAVAFTTAVGYTSFLVSPLLVGGVAAATNLRVGLGLIVITTLVLASLGARWPLAQRTTPEVTEEG